MIKLYELVEQLKERIGGEFDAWREHPEGNATPDHQLHWHAVRLLIFAAEHGELSVLTEQQLNLVRSHVKLPQGMLNRYKPQPQKEQRYGYPRLKKAA